MGKIKGIDISYWQGNVDFTKVKNDGIKFLILREGFRQTIDGKFLEYVKGATSAGIPILGIYHFSYALNVEQAKQEAIFCVNNLKKVGLGKDVIVFFDFEYDTVKQAKEKGVTLGKTQCIAHTKAFCEQVTALGYKAGIYSNIDYYKNMYDKDLISKYVFWLAHYTSGDPAYTCTFQQYGSTGKVNGINGNVDMDWYFEKEVKTVSARTTYLNTANKYVGAKIGTKAHHQIVDIFNKVKPDGWAMTYSAAWCACFVSAIAIEAFGITKAKKYFPLSANCGTIINKAKNLGIWVENDAYKPNTGDWVLYDWDDSGKGDNTGSPDHVGIVKKVSGSTITVIEGNYSNMVKERNISVNGRYIRGFVTPKYSALDGGTSSSGSTTTTKPASGTTTTKKKVTAKDSAKSFNKNLAGTYKTTDALNIRTGAGTSKAILVTVPKGTKVQCYGYYTTVSGVKWYYVQFTYNKILYTGFCSSKYLKK